MTGLLQPGLCSLGLNLQVLSCRDSPIQAHPDVQHHPQMNARARLVAMPGATHSSPTMHTKGKETGREGWRKREGKEWKHNVSLA